MPNDASRLIISSVPGTCTDGFTSRSEVEAIVAVRRDCGRWRRVVPNADMPTIPMCEVAQWFHAHVPFAESCKSDEICLREWYWGYQRELARTEGAKIPCHARHFLEVTTSGDDDIYYALLHVEGVAA